MSQKIEITKADYVVMRQRLARIKAIQGLLDEEVVALTAMIHVIAPEEEEPAAAVASIPVSAAGAGHIDHEAILRSLEESRPDLVLAPSKSAGEEKSLPPSALHGGDGIIARFLSPEVLRMGKGVIKPNEVLKQYDEDINKANWERLLLWPEGFYRNSITSEVQLCVKSSDRRILYRIDGLPGEELRVTFCMREDLIRQWIASTAPISKKEEENKYREFRFPPLQVDETTQWMANLLKEAEVRLEETLSAYAATVNATA